MFIPEGLAHVLHNEVDVFNGSDAVPALFGAFGGKSDFKPITDFTARAGEVGG